MGKYTPNPEHVLQASVAQFFKAWLPADMPWSSVDHGITFKGDALQRMNTWNRLAARGVKRGIHDIPIIFWRGRLHSIELKAPGGDLEDDQRAWGAKMIAQGGTWDVCESRAEVWASMARAFGDDNPLRPPPAILQIWLAKDALPIEARTVRVRKASGPRATGRQIAAGNRVALAMARGK
jgi:hypothetical protein